jgi:5-methylcytosine-specific restriction endonuclease McrA
MSEVRMRKYGCLDCCDEIPETEKYCEKCKDLRKNTAVCKGCSKRFIFKNGKNAYATGYYCNLCLSKKGEVLLKTENCFICNNKFYKKSENHKYCSDACRDVVRSLEESDRFLIFQRDNFRCLYCGRSPADGEELTLDHIYPYSMGGSHTAGFKSALTRTINNFITNIPTYFFHFLP